MRIQKRQITINKDKLVKQIVLDTKPNSPVRARFEAILKTRMIQAGFLTAKYYMGNLQAIGEILKEPGIQIFQGRPQRVSRPRRPRIRNIPMMTPVFPSKRFISSIPITVSVPLESGTTTPEAWQPLTEQYVKGEGRWEGLPRSYTLWKKTGELSSTYWVWLDKQQERLSLPSNYLGRATVSYPSVTGVKLPSKPRLSTLTFKLKYPLLLMSIQGNPGGMVRDSFIAGKAKPLGPKPPTRYIPPKLIRLPSGEKVTTKSKTVIDARGLNRLYLAESARPMIARFSAAMGREYMKALRNSFKR